jgi:glycosyltransferase involved in cell wall biosynthesis
MASKRTRNAEQPARGPWVLPMVSNVGFGGIAVQARDISGELYKVGLASEILLLKASEATSETIIWYEEKMPVSVLPANLEHRHGKNNFFGLLRFFKRRPEWFFHIHCFSQEYLDWQLILAARFAGKKIFATFHHTVGWVETRLRTKLLSTLSRAMIDVGIVTTEAGRQLVGQKTRLSKLRVIPCGIETNLPCPNKPSRKVELGLHPDDFVIVCICRMGKAKGILDLIDAFKAIGSEFPRAHLIFAGDGELLNELVKEKGESTQIHILGRIADKSKVLEAANLFAMPSYEEGFGLVYAEAAALGVPSIAGDLPTVREVVLGDRTGWLVAPGNKKDLTDTLLHCLRNPIEVMDRGAQAKVYVRRFDIALVGSAYITMFKDHLERAGV